MSVKQLERHLKFKFNRRHFATPTSETQIRCNFSPLLVRVQSLMSFGACLGPQNAIQFGEEEETEQFK